MIDWEWPKLFGDLAETHGFRPKDVAQMTIAQLNAICTKGAKPKMTGEQMDRVLERMREKHGVQSS